MTVPRVGCRASEFTGDEQLRSHARITYDPNTDHVYIELRNKHNDVVVYNTIRIERAEFSAKVKNLGCL